MGSCSSHRSPPSSPTDPRIPNVHDGRSIVAPGRWDRLPEEVDCLDPVDLAEVLSQAEPGQEWASVLVEEAMAVLELALVLGQLAED